MPEFAFAVPVVAGKEDLDRQVLQEMEGPRREEYEAALREAGMTRQAIWHQQTPAGTVAVVLVEGDDPVAAVAAFGASDAPFNRWFREQMEEVHGIDISQGAPDARNLHDVTV